MSSSDVSGFRRVLLEGLLILLGLLAFQKRSVLYALPLLFFFPRIALQYEAELKTMLRGMQ